PCRRADLQDPGQGVPELPRHHAAARRGHPARRARARRDPQPGPAPDALSQQPGRGRRPSSRASPGAAVMSGVAPAAPVAPVPPAASQAQGNVGPATPGTVPQTPSLAATVVNPPAALARLAAGTVLDGQVLARDAALNQAIVKTIHGEVTVKLPNPPAEGSRIALQLQGTSGEARAALLTLAPPAASAAAGSGAAGAQPQTVTG